jgi:hypothetical protein
MDNGNNIKRNITIAEIIEYLKKEIENKICIPNVFSNNIQTSSLIESTQKVEMTLDSINKAIDQLKQCKDNRRKFTQLIIHLKVNHPKEYEELSDKIKKEGEIAIKEYITDLSTLHGVKI